MDKQQALTALAALAHDTRLAAFRLLVQAGEAGMAAGELATALDVGATALSFHLKQLSTAGLVKSRACGRSLIYRAAYDHMNGLIAYLTENCCAGSSCAVDVAAGTSICTETQP